MEPYVQKRTLVNPLELHLLHQARNYSLKFRFHALARQRTNSDVSKRHKQRKTVDIILHQ